MKDAEGRKEKLEIRHACSMDISRMDSLLVRKMTASNRSSPQQSTHVKSRPVQACTEVGTEVGSAFTGGYPSTRVPGSGYGSACTGRVVQNGIRTARWLPRRGFPRTRWGRGSRRAGAVHVKYPEPEVISESRSLRSSDLATFRSVRSACCLRARVNGHP